MDQRIRWHYTTTILRLRIGARLTRYRNCKFHNFARSVSRHADGISRYSVPPSAGPLLPLFTNHCNDNLPGSADTPAGWVVKVKGSPYSITERRVPELIPVLGSQPAGNVSHKPGVRLPLLSARPAVTPATLKRGATNFAALWTEARWVWTVCLRLLPYSVTAVIWTQALLRMSPAR